MRLTRARYVTICQQFLVTAAVVAVGLSAAGVMTLQIVAPEQQVPGGAAALAPAVQQREAYVATRPVTATVREVKVKPMARKVAKHVAGPTARVAKPVALSKPTAVHGYAAVGVTGAPGTRLAEDQIAVQIRAQKNGTWSG